MAEIKNSIRRFILINKIFLKKSVWIAKRENSYQTMTAAGTAKRKNSPTPTKAFLEKEMRVFSQAEEYLTKDKSIITLNQTQRLKEIAAPTCPNPSLKTRVQHVTTWKHKAIAEVRIMGEIKLWVWKNRVKLVVELIVPVACEQGMRFAIREGGKTVGAGVIQSIIE